MKTFLEYLKEDVNAPYIHYSNRQGLTQLSGSMSGSGIKGAETERLAQTKDSRIKKRVYFYPPVQGALPKPEVGLGIHTYEADLDNMHDARKQSVDGNNIATTAKKHVESGEHPQNAFERAVLDHGFKGYHTDNMSVVLNHDVPVKYVGSSVGKNFKTPLVNTKESKKSVFEGIPNKQDEHSSSLLNPSQVSFWQKNQEKMKSAAPSTRMQYGRLYVHKDHLDGLKNELDKHEHHPF